MFGLRNRHDWTFLQFATVLLNVILIYMIAGLVFPDLAGDKVVDLKENFYAHRGWFFSLAFATIVSAFVKRSSWIIGCRSQPISRFTQSSA
jgi:hypothetical protein